MKKQDKEEIIAKLHKAVEREQTVRSKLTADDRTGPVGEYHSGKIDGMMESINLVRGT